MLMPSATSMSSSSNGKGPPDMILLKFSTPHASATSCCPKAIVLHASQKDKVPLPQAPSTFITGWPTRPISLSVLWPTPIP